MIGDGEVQAGKLPTENGIYGSLGSKHLHLTVHLSKGTRACEYDCTILNNPLLFARKKESFRETGRAKPERMGSISSNKIPSINFAINELNPGTCTWCSVRTKVCQALEEYGCFEAVFDDKVQLLQTMMSASKELFDLPQETKTKYIPNAMEGYFENLPLMPLYESFGIKNFHSLERLQCFTNLMWPEGNPLFCETMKFYFKQVSELENMVKRMVCESFGVEGYYDSLVESTTYRLRLMKYNTPITDEATVGFVPHKDVSFVTILGQNDVSGLEIELKDGKWISVKPSASSFIVMVGEVFMAWSNDKLHAPLHRVMMTGEGVRYSVAVLSHCEDIVQVPKEIVDDKHPLLYKPFSHSAYHAFVLTKDAKMLKTKIKAFCGVDPLH